MHAIAQHTAAAGSKSPQKTSGSQANTAAGVGGKEQGKAFSSVMGRVLGAGKSAGKPGESSKSDAQANDWIAMLMLLASDPQALIKLLSADGNPNAQPLVQAVKQLLSQISPQDQQAVMASDQVKTLIAGLKQLMRKLQPGLPAASAATVAPGGEAAGAPTVKQLQALLDQLAQDIQQQPASANPQPAVTNVLDQLTGLAHKLLAIWSQEQAANGQDQPANGAKPNPAAQSPFAALLKPRLPASAVHDQASAQAPVQAANRPLVQVVTGSTKSGFALADRKTAYPAQWIGGAAESPSDASADGPQTPTPLSLPHLQTPLQNGVPKPPPVPVQAQNFANEFSGFMLKSMKISQFPGFSEAKISLVPEQLGKVDVQLTIKDGQLVAQFFTDNSHAKELLEGQMQQLKNVLQDQGIQVGKLQVSEQTAAQSQLFHERDRSSARQFGEQNKRKTPVVSPAAFDDSLVAVQWEDSDVQRSMLYGGSFHAQA